MNQLREVQLNAVPSHVLDVLHQLCAAGYDAYFIGGCVRDLLLGRTPWDWDIATSALPSAVMQIFPQTLSTGISHGTVTVCSEADRIEVTTFRRETHYADHRRPDSVIFVPKLETDVLRRDFTMNAIAMDQTGAVIDLTGGIKDLKDGIIRCIGDANIRFAEDALRMFRAYRFAAQFGFTLSPETHRGLLQNASLARCLAPERIYQELEKALSAPYTQYVYAMVQAGLFTCCGVEIKAEHHWVRDAFTQIGAMEYTKLQAWTAVCTILKKAEILSAPEVFLERLHMSKRMAKPIITGVTYAVESPPKDAVDWKCILSRHGRHTALCAAAGLSILGDATANQLDMILRENACFSRQQLQITGRELVTLGYTGKEIGVVLEKLLSIVLEHPEKNTLPILQTLAVQMRKSI